MIIGFTGTQKGMTPAQVKTLQLLLEGAAELHHGDCIGADAQAHKEALSRSIPVVIHPPIDSEKRAFCEGAREVFATAPYLDRNRHIVHACDRLIAAPSHFREALRSGTWATVRYARADGKPVTIILPNGDMA